MASTMRRREREKDGNSDQIQTQTKENHKLMTMQHRRTYLKQVGDDVLVCGCVSICSKQQRTMNILFERNRKMHNPSAAVQDRYC